MPDDVTINPPENPPADPAPPAESADPLAQFIASKQAEAQPSDPPPPAEKPPASPGAAQEGGDGVEGFLSGKPKPADAAPPADPEKDDPAPEGGDPEDGEPTEDDPPRTRESWERAKQSIRERVEAEFQNRLQTLQQKLDEQKTQFEEVSGELSKYNLSKSPAYKAQFVEPKRQAVADIERLGGDSPEVKRLVDSMRAGTLTVSSVPNLDSLGEFQKRRIYDIADKWIATNEAEQKALEEHQETQKQLEIQDLELEQQRAKTYQKRVADQLHLATSKATVEASAHLQGFGQEHVAKMMAQLGDQNVMEHVGRAMAVAAWVPDHLRTVQQSHQALTEKLQAAESRVAELEKRLGGVDDLNRITTSPGTKDDQGGQTADPMASFIQRIAQT